MIAKVRNVGDGFNHRLLLYLSKLTGERFQMISKIKEGIWIGKSNRGNWIVKEFPSFSRLNNQKMLVEKLHQYGFSNTYQFHPVHSHKKCVLDNKVFGLMEVIEKGDTEFSFRSHLQRQDALSLLKSFHFTTRQFKDEFRARLKVFNQIDKWQLRLNEFKTNLPQLQTLIPSVYLQTYLEWAEWALQNLKSFNHYFLQEPTCIIHGDVAHHNFYLGQDRDLYLIDFDLISLATEKIDELQMANRILPFLSWSLKELSQYETYTKYLNEEAFLFALIFPTDILREWNRFLRTKHNSKGYLNYLSEITLNQFTQRKFFVNEIKKML